jgi:hypothetical protein
MKRVIQFKTSQKLRIGVLLIIVFLLIYLPSLIFWARGTEVAKGYIVYDGLLDSVNVDAVLVRQEELLYAKESGIFVAILKEGARVRSQDELGSLVTKEQTRLQEELLDIEMRISDAVKANEENKSMYSSDVVKIEQMMFQSVQDISKSQLEKKFLETYELKKQLQELMRKKIEVTADTKGASQFISDLKEKRAAILNQMSNSASVFRSPQNGILSYSIDGYEGTFKEEVVMNLTTEDIERIKADEGELSKDRFLVEKERPFAKLILGQRYQMAFFMPKERFGAIKENQPIKIKLHNQEQFLDAKVESIREGDTKNQVVVSSNIGMESTSLYRKLNIDIVRDQYFGLKVPIRSIKNFDAFTKTGELAVLKADHVRFVPVIIKGYNDEFAIVENKDPKYPYKFGLYSSFILNPLNIEEGQWIR